MFPSEFEKKRIILRVPTFSWGNWICNQILKIFILKFWFFYTFCEFWHSRIKPRILKIVFFFLHHGSRWTFWQYGAVLCFLQWGLWNNSLNWRKVFKCLNFIWQTWYLKYKLFTRCFCPWVFRLLWKPKLFFQTFITTKISIPSWP